MIEAMLFAIMMMLAVIVGILLYLLFMLKTTMRMIRRVSGFVRDFFLVWRYF
jgi:hypothetical protein